MTGRSIVNWWNHPSNLLSEHLALVPETYNTDFIIG